MEVLLITKNEETIIPNARVIYTDTDELDGMKLKLFVETTNNKTLPFNYEDIIFLRIK